MPTVAVLPVKSFSVGKGRLAAELSAEARARLGQALAERIAQLTVQAGLIPLLIAGDGEVADWAILHGLPALLDPGTGLDGAAATGAAWADTSASNWLVLHVDLPLLAISDLEALLSGIAEHGAVIAPSADGGTSALGGYGAAVFSYGPGSFHRHLGRFPGAAVVARPGLLHDVDTFGDLESARQHPLGTWLARIG